MNVKIKKIHENAIIPKYAKHGDAGMDLVATEIDLNGCERSSLQQTAQKNLWISSLNNNSIITYKLGISIEIPIGYVGLIFPRSSIKKYDLLMANSVGVIDSGYRGELQINFNLSNKVLGKAYDIGDRIAQLIILKKPDIVFIETDYLSDSDRGDGGFGSTGI